MGKSSSFITAFDWSVDGSSIVTNDASYEILYYQVPSTQDKWGATTYRDELWYTYTCMLGWATAGIWEAGYDGTDINTVDRSNRTHDGF